MRYQQQVRHTSAFDAVRQEIGATVRHLIVATFLSIVLSAVLVEAVGMAITWAPPALPTHLAAGVVALALGYAAAVTVLFRALLRGIGRSAGWVTSEIEDATERMLHDGSRQHASGGTASMALAVPTTGTSPTQPLATLEHGMMAGIRAK